MPEPSRDALLAAIRDAAKRMATQLERETYWPQVAAVMNHLTGENMTGEEWRRKYRTLRERVPDTAKLSASVPADTYSDILQDAFHNELRVPSQPHKPAKEKQQPEYMTAEEPDIKSDVELKKQRMRADYFEKGYAKLIEEEATFETFLERIGEAVSAVDPITPVQLPMPAVVLWNRPRIFMPILSDMHVGEKVEGKNIKGFNEFNFNVLDERLDRWCTTIEEQFQYQRALGPVEQIYLPMIGDMVTGENIYRGQWMHIETTVMHQVFEGADRLSGAIMRLARLGVPMTITGVGGNHARMGKRNESDFSNDFMMYKHLEAKLANQPNINWEFDWAFWTTAKFWDWRFYFCHGHNIRGWGGFPWYGQARADANTLMLMLTQGQWYHFFIHGHFHTDMSLQTPIGKRFANGNWIGTTEYGVAGGFGGRPSQKLLIITEKGGVESEMPIYLDEIKADFMNQTMAGHGLGMSQDPSI